MTYYNPTLYGKNAATDEIEPIELSDSRTGFTFLDQTAASLSMPASGDDLVWSETAMPNTAIRPGGNMVGWEVSADFSVSANFENAGGDRNAMVCLEAFFSRLPASGAFVDGVTENPTDDPYGSYLFYGTNHVAILRVWFIARRLTEDSLMSVTWFGGAQDYWGQPQWLVEKTLGSGWSMDVTLKVALGVPSFRSGRCTLQRLWPSPWYIPALGMNAPEAGLGTAWNVNMLEKPLLRNGLDAASPLLSESLFRTTMSGRQGGILLNTWDTDEAALSVDVSYLRNSDVRPVSFTSTGDVSYSWTRDLTPSTYSAFPLPYNGQNHIIQRIGRRFYTSEYDDTITASISNARARVIDPT